MKHYFAALVAVISLTLGVTGCGQEPGAARADVEFVQAMIPHHEQALDMAERVIVAGSDPAVQELAARIKAAQTPEIEQMEGWLDDWGEPRSEHGAHSSEDDMGSDGMMSDADMEAFDDATGSDLDRQFLELMIRHHEGAIDMAKGEITDGEDPDVIALAEAVVSDQQAEIEEMRQLLEQLG